MVILLYFYGVLKRHFDRIWTDENSENWNASSEQRAHFCYNVNHVQRTVPMQASNDWFERMQPSSSQHKVGLIVRHSFKVHTHWYKPQAIAASFKPCRNSYWIDNWINTLSIYVEHSSNTRPRQWKKANDLKTKTMNQNNKIGGSDSVKNIRWKKCMRVNMV